MMALAHWNPIRDAASLREAMDRLFEEQRFRSTLDWERDQSPRAWRLPVDVYSTPEEIVIQAAVAGLKPEDVEITLEGDTLTIRGQLPHNLENVDYYFHELPTGRFVRVLSLNVATDADRAEARFEDGLLTLTIPKAAAARPRQIQVRTG